MSKPQAPSALKGFLQLAPATYMYEPPATSQLSQSSSPEIILLPAWMDAQPKHIAKYTASYQALYPSATILVITTAAKDFLFTTQASTSRRIAAVLKVLYSLPPNAKILLHCFSNGGTTTSCAIAAEYRAHTGHSIPMRLMVIDSAPGSPKFFQGVQAFRHSLPPNWLLRVVGTAFFLSFFLVYMCVHVALRKKDVLTRMRERLVDKRVFPLESKRLYVYSKEDRLVGYADVEAHAAMSREAGFETRLELFEGTSHVAHMMGDSKRYWASVQSLWNEE